MDLGLKDKVALVTGATQGLGLAIAAGFVAEGAKVVLVSRSPEKGRVAVESLKKAGGDCVYVQADVAKATDVERLVASTLDRYGRLDCTVNNAAIEAQRPFIDWTEEEWDETIDINLKGVWLCMKYSIKQMLKQGAGSIVNVSSIAGVRGFPLHAPYVASKHGVLGLTRSASMEYAKQGIRVNTVCPGIFMTPMLEKGFVDNPENSNLAASLTQMGRIGRPEELASAVLWLCSEQASFTTGITIAVDGGWTQH
ncbi:MAG: glucose 1-dehydrogenase [Rhizomicrobium sp.]